MVQVPGDLSKVGWPARFDATDFTCRGKINCVEKRCLPKTIGPVKNCDICSKQKSLWLAISTKVLNLYSFESNDLGRAVGLLDPLSGDSCANFGLPELSFYAIFDDSLRATTPLNNIFR